MRAHWLSEGSRICGAAKIRQGPRWWAAECGIGGRARLHGGTLTAEPLPQSGFEVVLTLPKRQAGDGFRSPAMFILPACGSLVVRIVVFGGTG